MAQSHTLALVNRQELALRNWSSALSPRERLETSSYSNSERRERSVISRMIVKYLITTRPATGFRRPTAAELFSACGPEWRDLELLSGTQAKRSTPRIFRHGNAYTDVSASSSHCGPYSASLLAQTRAGLDLVRVELRRPEF